MDRRDFLKRGGAASVGATMGATLGVSDRPASAADLPLEQPDVVFSMKLIGDDYDHAVARTAARFSEEVELATNGRIRIVVAGESDTAASSLEIGLVSAFADEHDGWSALSPLGIGTARTARTWVLVGGGAALVQQLGLVHGWRAHLVGEVEKGGDPSLGAETNTFVVARFRDADWLALSPGDHAAVAAVATASLARGSADVEHLRHLQGEIVCGTPFMSDVARVFDKRRDNRQRIEVRNDPLARSILDAFDAWSDAAEPRVS
ncbi:MAG: twin-arginine translocation signal domain-containing protein [Pseudomonadota bacterium]